MRDSRVPLGSKFLAFLAGFGITGVVEVLEWPVEGILAAVLPFLGIAGDVAVDGMEIVAGPLLLANLLLPYLAPREIVDIIRSERAAGKKSPIIDV